MLQRFEWCLAVLALLAVLVVPVVLGVLVVLVVVSSSFPTLQSPKLIC